MLSRLITKLLGASIFTKPGEYTAVAFGLSAKMASTTGRDSSLTWKAMNTLDMTVP
jgi:hypothetical protein